MHSVVAWYANVLTDAWLSLRDWHLHLCCLQRNKERFVVLEDFKSKDKDHLSVKKGEVVYLVSNKKHDKNWRYVCNFTADKLGLVPAKILRKEANNNVEGLFVCLCFFSVTILIVWKLETYVDFRNHNVVIL